MSQDPAGGPCRHTPKLENLVPALAVAAGLVVAFAAAARGSASAFGGLTYPILFGWPVQAWSPPKA